MNRHRESLTPSLARLGIVVFIGSLIIFCAVRIIPGDGLELRGRYVDPERVAMARTELGLDRSWVDQYGGMLLDFASGSWGRSVVTGREVWPDFIRRFTATLELVVGGILVGTIIGIAAVLIGEASRGRFGRSIPRLLIQLGLVFPLFWLGLLGLYLGCHLLGIFPTGGRAPVGVDASAGATGLFTVDSLIKGDFARFTLALHYLILPVFVLSLFPAAVVATLLQSRLHDDRVAALRLALIAKGVGPIRLWGVHLLRLCAPVLTTALGTQFGVLLGGAVITEAVFSWPGVGSYLIQGVLNRDLFLIQNSLLFLLCLITLVLALSESLTRMLSPD